MRTKKRDPEVTSRIMSQIKSKGTKVELLLASALRKAKIKFRRHYPLPGKPDFIVFGLKIAIFCDGDFWHGNNWRIRGMDNQAEDFNKLTPFWVKKITTNMARDKRVNLTLRKKGWKVLRFWESDIKRDPKKIIKKIEATMRAHSFQYSSHRS